jgi:hypothetical protein
VWGVGVDGIMAYLFAANTVDYGTSQWSFGRSMMMSNVNMYMFIYHVRQVYKGCLKQLGTVCSNPEYLHSEALLCF